MGYNMKRTIKISYGWKCENFKKIPEPLAEALEETAMERIKLMMDQGYTSGQLLDTVNIDVPGHRTPEDGWDCQGWFDIEKK